MATHIYHNLCNSGTFTDTSEILSVYGIDESPSEDDHSADIKSFIRGRIRDSFEHDPELIRVILHNAGYDGYLEEPIRPTSLGTIDEHASVSLSVQSKLHKTRSSIRDLMTVGEVESADDKLSDIVYDRQSHVMEHIPRKMRCVHSLMSCFCILGDAT
jgi:hypothetical protein